MIPCEKIVIGKIWHCKERYWRAGVCAKFGVARKNTSVRVCALNFSVAKKNVGVQDRTINLALRGVHKHNNDACGVRNVGKAQRSFFGARVMWVYVVARQFS
jgi:hypothetical protein